MSRLLLVEDSQVQALVAQAALEGAGHRVQHVRNFEEAIKVCYQDAPDLVVTDQHLGEVSGLELCRRIKSDVPLSVIPVLMLTGSHARKDHVAALDAGADGFLCKDNSSDELLALISHLLETVIKVEPLAAGNGPSDPARHRTRILAVDDSPTFLASLCKKLEESGFEVRSAASAREGLKLLDEQPFDVAVTDVVMPEMDGFQFAQQARQWAARQNRQLGVLVLTGADRKEVLIQSLEAGADDYVNKSQDLDVIVAHATAIARRVVRTRQIESMNQELVRKEHELREAEVHREQAEERVRLADELDRANQALVESNQQLKHVALLASQDLKAPMSRMISCCEFLQNKDGDRLDAESTEHLQELINSAQSIQQLIGDLMAKLLVNSNEEPDGH